MGFISEISSGKFQGFQVIWSGNFFAPRKSIHPSDIICSSYMNTNKGHIHLFSGQVIQLLNILLWIEVDERRITTFVSLLDDWFEG